MISRIALLFVLIATFGCSSQGSSPDLNGKMNVLVTFYWTVSPDSSPQAYRSLASSDYIDVKHLKGHLIDRAPANIVKKILLEGSGYLPPSKKHPKGQLINLACECDSLDSASFILVDKNKAPWGLDARGKGLVPMKTIAVDQSIVKLGTPIFIPSLKGLNTAFGQHNGCVVAGDIGPAIKGARIDIFSGRKRDYQKIESKFNMKKIDIFVNHPACSS